MTDLTTDYMGMRLRSPVLVGASTLSGHLFRLRQAEEAGAGAVVLRSLFEEQIRTNAQELQMFLEEAARVNNPWGPLSVQTVPPGPEAYLEWAQRVRDAVSIPVIGSLNATSPGKWVEFARRLESCGVNAIELNIYRLPSDPDESSVEIEDEMVEIVRSVCDEVDLPVAVKIGPFYTAPAQLAHRFVDAGAEALVLFNRFFQPDIDVDDEVIVSELEFSSASEIKLPLRWIALLYGRIGADLALTTGVHTGRDIVKAILAGAAVVQVASALYRHGMDHLRDMHAELTTWMERKNYSSLTDFRGKLSQFQHGGAADLERAHYVKLLMAQT